MQVLCEMRLDIQIVASLKWSGSVRTASILVQGQQHRRQKKSVRCLEFCYAGKAIQWRPRSSLHIRPSFLFFNMNWSACRHNQLRWGQEAYCYPATPKINLTRAATGIQVNGKRSLFSLMCSVGQRVGCMW